jgi:hypothetical protein
MPAVPTGTLFSVATTFGSNITVTAVTNANPAVCTATAHGLSNGDVIEVTSGWGRLNKRVFEVANVATNTFELEGMDTSSTSFFPAGTGIGTVREVTAWTQLSKVMNPATQGGDPKTVTTSSSSPMSSTRSTTASPPPATRWNSTTTTPPPATPPCAR